MVQPSAKLQSFLAAALLKLCRDPGLSADEAQWVRQFAMRLLAEFAALKAAPSKPVSSKSAAA